MHDESCAENKYNVYEQPEGISINFTCILLISLVFRVTVVY